MQCLGHFHRYVLARAYASDISDSYLLSIRPAMSLFGIQPWAKGRKECLTKSISFRFGSLLDNQLTKLVVCSLLRDAKMSTPWVLTGNDTFCDGLPCPQDMRCWRPKP